MISITSILLIVRADELIELKEKSFSLSWNFKQYNEVSSGFGYREENARVLVFKAFYNKGDVYHRCRIDILKLGDKSQIYDSSSISLNLTKSLNLMDRRANMYVTLGRIFFYSNIDSMDGKDDIIRIHEYNFQGDLIHNYCLISNEKGNQILKFESTRDATYFIKYDRSKILEHNNVRIWKLEKGKAFPVLKHEIFVNNYVRDLYERCDVLSITKRFGQWIWPQLFQKRPDDTFIWPY